MSNDKPIVPVHYITGIFDSETAKEFVKFNADALKDGATHAIVYINSFGGSCHAYTAISNIMQSSPIEYHTCNLAECASAALATLVQGNVRWAAPNARFMYHQSSGVSFGDVDQMQEEVNLYKKEYVRINKEIAKRTKETSKWWDDKCKSFATRMFWFDTKEAKRRGVIDEIGIPHVRIIPETIQIVKG